MIMIIIIEKRHVNFQCSSQYRKMFNLQLIIIISYYLWNVKFFNFDWNAAPNRSLFC